ncbi:MAG: ferritin-like domain-containing protein [Gemmatimonadales bacterium]
MARNANSRDLLTAWLRDAYAMEKALIPVLENHAKDAKRHPNVRARIEQHAQETQRHAQLVEDCLRQFGEEPSTMKNTFARVAGSVQSVASGAFKDDEVKNALSGYATENFEIACYRALIEAGRMMQHQDVVRSCEQILREEEAMAKFLEQNLPTTVHDALAQAA